MEVRKGEMTREAFLRLHEIEAESGDFNPDDMYQRLFNLGFNKSLEIDHVIFCLLVIIIFVFLEFRSFVY